MNLELAAELPHLLITALALSFRSAKQNCFAEEVLEDTEGMLVERRGEHGLCLNPEPIAGLTECHGKCSSSTFFNSRTLAQESDCHCCSPLEYEEIIVKLVCEDESVIEKRLQTPKTCTCEPCTSAKASVKTSKSNVETNVKG